MILYLDTSSLVKLYVGSSCRNRVDLDSGPLIGTTRATDCHHPLAAKAFILPSAPGGIVPGLWLLFGQSTGIFCLLHYRSEVRIVLPEMLRVAVP